MLRSNVEILRVSHSKPCQPQVNVQINPSLHSNHSAIDTNAQPPHPARSSSERYLRSPLHPAFTNKYTLLSDLGEGGFGFVCLAVNNHTHQHFAVKFILKAKIPEHAWIMHGSQRVLMECYILKRVRHECIIGYVEEFEDERFVYLVTEVHGTPWNAQNTHTVADLNAKTTQAKSDHANTILATVQEKKKEQSSELNSKGLFKLKTKELPSYRNALLTPLLTPTSIDAHILPNITNSVSNKPVTRSSSQQQTRTQPASNPKVQIKNVSPPASFQSNKSKSQQNPVDKIDTSAKTLASKYSVSTQQFIRPQSVTAPPSSALPSIQPTPFNHPLPMRRSSSCDLFEYSFFFIYWFIDVLSIINVYQNHSLSTYSNNSCLRSHISTVTVLQHSNRFTERNMSSRYQGWEHSDWRAIQCEIGWLWISIILQRCNH